MKIPHIDLFFVFFCVFCVLRVLAVFGLNATLIFSLIIIIIIIVIIIIIIIIIKDTCTGNLHWIECSSILCKFLVPETFKQPSNQSAQFLSRASVQDSGTSVLRVCHPYEVCGLMQILIRNLEAYGVEFFRNNTLTQVRARKEVIVSAGAIGSPHLLMLSGIGPRRQLESFDVS